MSDPSPASRCPRESIRPSAKDLATYDADALEWPPAAKVSKGGAPPILISSIKGKGKDSTTEVERTAIPGEASTTVPPRVGKTVRIAQPTEEDVRYYQPASRERSVPSHSSLTSSYPGTSRSQDFRTTDANASFEDTEEEGFGMPNQRFRIPLDEEHLEVKPKALHLPMVASVQERPRKQAISRDTDTGNELQSSLPVGLSRFKAIKEAERRAGQAPFPSGSQGSERLIAPPRIGLVAGSHGETQDHGRDAVSGRDDNAINGAQSEDEWLDENGKTMSAFRKARLKKQGIAPPGGIVKSKAQIRGGDQERAWGSQGYDEDMDDGGSPSQEGSLPSLLQSISQENAERLRAMDEAEVAQDLRDLEAMFGKDMLEGLRQRSQAKSGPPPQPPQVPVSVAKGSIADPTAASSADLTPGPIANDIRRPSVSKSKKQSAVDSILFDARGKVMQTPEQPADSYHGHSHVEYDTDHANEGHTSSSLLLMARSTIPSQRTVALSVISRVCSLYPPLLANEISSEVDLKLTPATIPDRNAVAFWLRKSEFHLNAARISNFLLNDRQKSVRSAALSCLRASLLFGPALHEHSSASEEKTAHSVAKRLIDAGLLSGFSNVLRGDEEERRASRELIVQILLQLADVDPQAATTIIQAGRGRLLGTILQVGLKMKWPHTIADATASNLLLPSPACAHLLLQLVRSSRENAERLVRAGFLDVLLRFAAVPPWTLDRTEHGADAITVGIDLLSTSLQLFHDLACYGFYASLVSRAWEVFQPLHLWATTVTFPTQPEAQIIERLYRLLAVWTICATDPHQTTPEHEVTWSQAEGWIELSMDALPTFLGSIEEQSQTHMLSLCGVLSHIDAWLEGAKRNVPARRSEIVEQVKSLIATLSPQSKSMLALQSALTSIESAAIDSTDPADEESKTSPRSEGLFAFACEAAAVLLKLADTVDLPSLQQVLLASGKRLVTQSEALTRMLVTADQSQRLQILSLVVHIIQMSFQSTELPRILAVLSQLKLGEEAFAVRLIESCLLAAAGGEASRWNFLKCLRPFYLECLGIRPNPTIEAQRPLLYRPVKVGPEVLKRTLSIRPALAVDRKAKAKEIGRETDHDEEGEDSTNQGSTDVERDPVTNTPLWQCPASGLPLRVDWLLLPLDDLLRSAESSVFNRPDNLPADWDPNERQVVQATLDFTNYVLKSLVTQSDRRGSKSRLTSTHLYFAAQKIFMLESGIQGDLKKWTGAVTGKDLFRDKSIAPLLEQMLSLANQLPGDEENSKEVVTLEQLATEHLGEETTYYSFYTDLIGLYDSISYGDPSFGKCLLPPTTTTTAVGSRGPAYAVDYRRLLWQDYAHLLPTMRMRIEDAPGGLAAYLSPMPSHVHRRRSGSHVGQYIAQGLHKSSEDEDTDMAMVARDEDVMLQSYVSTLLAFDLSDDDQQGNAGATTLALSPQRQPLIFRIALDHVASFLWREVMEEEINIQGSVEGKGKKEVSARREREKRTRRSLARALFSSQRGINDDSIALGSLRGGGGGRQPVLGKRSLSDFLLRYDFSLLEKGQLTGEEAEAEAETVGQGKGGRSVDQIPLLPLFTNDQDDCQDSAGRQMSSARKRWLGEVLNVVG